MSAVSGAPRLASTSGRSVVLFPVALFAAALVTRLLLGGKIDVPATEPSAYYWGVARNLVEGRGLVSDAAWSHLAPHPVLPAPAFEFWLPLASFLAALPMALLGTDFEAAQLSSLVLGAFVAPLAWLVARSTARALGLPAERVAWVSLGSGLVMAVSGPLLVADAAPESTTAFTLFALLAALLAVASLPSGSAEPPSLAAGVGLPRPPSGRTLARIGLGVALGLAYLARQEAVWLGLAYLALLWAGPSDGSRLRALAPTVVAGALTVLPWLVRSLLTFGWPTPLGTLELALMVRNEDIFAVTDPPTLERFLAQGPGVIVGLQLGALARNLLDVVLIPSAPLGPLALVAILLVALRGLAGRRESGMPALLRRGGALGLLLAAGLAIYLATSLAFPVASAWGTFRHAAGPLLVGLGIVGVLALDWIVAEVRARRSWPRSNAWLAALAAVGVALPFGLLQITLFTAQADRLEARYEVLAVALEDLPDLAEAPRAGDPPGPRAAALSDHPIWLAETLRRPVLALPDETPSTVWRLARAYGVPLLVVVDERGRYPGVLLRGTDGCFTARHTPAATVAGAHLFAVEAEPCGPVAAR